MNMEELEVLFDRALVNLKKQLGGGFLDLISFTKKRNEESISLYVNREANLYSRNDKAILIWRFEKRKGGVVQVKDFFLPFFQREYSGAFKMEKAFIVMQAQPFCEIIFLREVLYECLMELFAFDAFGCCSKYRECSKQMRCIHADLLYATACRYRKSLENGKIFY